VNSPDPKMLRADRPVPATAASSLGPSMAESTAIARQESRWQRPDWMDLSMHRALQKQAHPSANGSVASRLGAVMDRSTRTLRHDINRKSGSPALAG